MKKTLGGDRLGAGKKMQVDLHGYGRSTHNLSRVWRSSMTQGTLVPFLVEPALNGDTFDIDISTLVRTLPTVGPVFGSFKMQLDVFLCPMRLYIAELHNNKLGIGMNMANVKLPMMQLIGPNPTLEGGEMNQQQINPSSLLAYLGVRGLGKNSNFEGGSVYKNTNAIPLLAYWDIYKNYYANKQEGIGIVLEQKEDEDEEIAIQRGETIGISDNIIYTQESAEAYTANPNGLQIITFLPVGRKERIYGDGLDRATSILLNTSVDDGQNIVSVIDVKNNPDWTYTIGDSGAYIDIYRANTGGVPINLVRTIDQGIVKLTKEQDISKNPGLSTFQLETIDEMREELLKQDAGTVVVINQLDSGKQLPYTSSISQGGSYVPKEIMAGLGIKTYLSDRFNNWLETEWIDGPNGIAAISAVDTSSGSFTMDSLNLAQKVYNMLNRIAVSGGSYEDWQEAVYGETVTRRAETPMYMGGASSEIVFNEVVSLAATGSTGEGTEQPLGTLAGRGRNDNHKGGTIRVKATEPSFVIGIVSLTPRVDYSQGNKWWTRMETMDDWHKPALDGIGFQELITDEMAAWDTDRDADANPVYKSAGKQPSWIEYMTSQNECYGTFSENDKEMFMTLSRRYQPDSNRNIQDLTTYIDPSMYNYAFTQLDQTAQNFWVQIGVDLKARRKMSAKMIPNL